MINYIKYSKNNFQKTGFSVYSGDIKMTYILKYNNGYKYHYILYNMENQKLNFRENKDDKQKLV